MTERKKILQDMKEELNKDTEKNQIEILEVKSSITQIISNESLANRMEHTDKSTRD
jgi:hypothetical protein